MELTGLLNKENNELSEEEKIKAEEFNEKLKDKIIDELVEYQSEELIKKFKRDKEIFIDSIYNLLVNGIKGYKNLNLKQLIELYISNKTQEDFTNLLEELN